MSMKQREQIEPGGGDLPENATMAQPEGQDGMPELAFDELEVEATDGNLLTVQSFVEEHLESAGCSLRAQMQISVAVEEVFVNIAHYAYAPDTGKAVLRMGVSDDPAAVTIVFIDRGVPFDPLAKEDPNVTLSAEERGIGGLGIFITKKTMDEVRYEYRDGQNILTLRKNL